MKTLIHKLALLCSVTYFICFINPIYLTFAQSKEKVPVEYQNTKHTRHIVIITNCTDIAANEIRASMLNELMEAEHIIIEPIVPVDEFSTLNYNFAVRLMADIYPEGTIFVVIFNSDQKRPESLIGQTMNKNFIFMGRNTGAFDWLTRDFGCKCLYDASELFTQINPEFLSFSGKLVTAPTAAKIAKGAKIANFGKPIAVDRIKRIKITGHTVVHIDNFGIMKFIGSIENLKLGDRYQITIGDNVLEAIYNKRMQSEATGRWVLFPGSSFGLYELGKIRCYGAQSINAKIGDTIKIQKISK